MPPGQETVDNSRREAIAVVARDLFAKRDAWLNLPGASDAVLDAYGWSHDLDDIQILERLPALKHQRAEAGAPDP